jgi:hypothetical protein
MTTYTIPNIVKHFELNHLKLAKLLHDTNSFIGGSAALCAFLSDEIYEDMDLDIFMRIEHNDITEIKLINDYVNNINDYFYYRNIEKINKKKFSDYLYSLNYKENTSNCVSNKYILSSCNKDINEIEYYNSKLSKYIKNITTFIKDNKKIQIITIYNYPFDEFIDTFDLNISKLSIKSDNINLSVYCDNLTLIEQQYIIDRKMYIMKPLYVPNINSRIIKYINRGFIYYDINNNNDNYDVHDNCGICLKAVKESQTTCTPCEHIFCSLCLQEWLKIAHTCPMCRQNILI